MLYCWRCGVEMPMLDEEEFAVVEHLFGAAFSATREFREQHGLPLGYISIEERFRPVLEAYERLTGFCETNPNAVVHHRLALFGPPCLACGKPLRSPRARRCMECGQPDPTLSIDAPE
jgi:hypothetical protein